MPATKKTSKTKAKTNREKTTAKKSVKKVTPAKKKPTKKTVSKKAAKKTGRTTAAKSTKSGERVLVCAAGQKCFWTTDGQVLSDLQELSSALDQMAEEVYKHHVTSEKNDFADWVEAVLEDEACAAALRRSRKPKSARTIVVRHLKLYSL